MVQLATLSAFHRQQDFAAESEVLRFSGFLRYELSFLAVRLPLLDKKPDGSVPHSEKNCMELC